MLTRVSLVLTLLSFLGLTVTAMYNRQAMTVDIPRIPESNDAIKHVHYVHRNDRGQYIIEQMPIRYIDVGSYRHDWIAKSVWHPNEFNTTGWAVLEIETNEKMSDESQAFAAGLLEGTVTKDFINMHLLNTVGDFCDQETTECNMLIDFLKNNFRWIKQMIEKNVNDTYWHQVNLLFHQFFGLYHGYENKALGYFESELGILETMIADVKPYMHLLALQLNGDMSELLLALKKASNPFVGGSCSALIKVLPNNQDIFVSHNTWTVFESMLRIMKHYKFNYRLNNLDQTIIPGSEMSFSSYPGMLSSIDDFYVIKSGLAVIETTIGNANMDLWKYVTTSTNLYWIRNLVSNRLATTGAEWSKYFSMFNSGTYNNEWMIIDFKKFEVGQPLKDGLFTVLEQLPGQTIWHDQTEVLRKQSYWPSYNLAFYPEIYNISGTYDSFLKYGSFFSYDHSPRASIFRRDHSNVVDIKSMMFLMRYNNFTMDPLSRCECDPPYSGENSIAARSDLSDPKGRYPFDALGHRDHGATDMKMTSLKMSLNCEFIGISGPTHGFPNVTPFIWSKADFGNTTNHFGHPDEWAFEPVQVKWTL